MSSTSATLQTLHIAVLAGDGIGPEIITQALAVLDAICKKYGHTLHYERALCGAAAIEAVGSPYPEATHELCMKSDAVLFGAVGDPKYDNNPAARVRPEQGLLAMRQKLGLYGNLRPVETYDALVHRSPLREEIVRGTNFMCVRELTGGIYFGRPQGRSEDGNTAYDSCVYTRDEITRVLTLAYDFAMQRRKKITIVDKANVLATSRLWREIAQHIQNKYPEVETEYLLVDSAAMRIIQAPTSFDVIVTENMFGDILTDEASVLTGSMGLLPSASVGTHTSVYEPIHGSFPQATGQNIANPLAMILSAAMMLEYTFKLTREAALVREAVAQSIDKNVRTFDIQEAGHQACSTSEVGEWIVNYIRAKV